MLRNVITIISLNMSYIFENLSNKEQEAVIYIYIAFIIRLPHNKNIKIKMY